MKTFQFGDWSLRLSQPTGPGPYPVVLLLHGWTGDEDVMWVFAPRLPSTALLLSPRGIYPAPQGGFGWHPHEENSWPSVSDLRPSVEALSLLLQSLKEYPEHPELLLEGDPDIARILSRADFSNLGLVGFSQGAALAYTYSLLHADQIRRLAGLAGFMPESAYSLIDERPLHGLPAFVAHGSKDDQVPVEKARKAVELLSEAGAEVNYCEDDVGHKLSADCFRALEKFFASS